MDRFEVVKLGVGYIEVMLSERPISYKLVRYADNIKAKRFLQSPYYERSRSIAMVSVNEDNNFI